jgi:hypothetical protein
LLDQLNQQRTENESLQAELKDARLVLRHFMGNPIARSSNTQFDTNASEDPSLEGASGASSSQP